MADSERSAPLRHLDRRTASAFFPKRTRRVYDLLAEVYPLSTMLFHSKAHKVAMSLAGDRDGMRVLEVATGSGEMFRRLIATVNPSGLTCGIDLSPNMAARTQRVARRLSAGMRAHCQAVDARSMPFRDGAFDAVVCCYLLELMGGDDIVQTMAEMHRVLRPNGRLALVLIGQKVPAFNALYKFVGSLAPAFLGRQVESSIPEVMDSYDFRVEHDRKVRQGLLSFARDDRPQVTAPLTANAFLSSSASARSFVRPVDSLFRSNAASPITGTSVSPIFPFSRPAHACSNSTPVIEVKRSIRLGGNPSWTTIPGALKSLGSSPSAAKPNSRRASISNLALSGEGRIRISRSPV